jgi:hypothetical protein
MSKTTSGTDLLLLQILDLHLFPLSLKFLFEFPFHFFLFLFGFLIVFLSLQVRAEKALDQPSSFGFDSPVPKNSPSNRSE